MASYERLILDPINLGHRAALGALRPAAEDDSRAITAQERVAILNDAASSLGMYNRPYWIEASYGISLPTEREFFDPGDIERYGITTEDDLEFAGTFSGYSRLKVGKIIGSFGLRRVSGLCATFDRAMILSGLESLEEGHALHVPILAVNIVDAAPDFL